MKKLLTGLSILGWSVFFLTLFSIVLYFSMTQHNGLAAGNPSSSVVNNVGIGTADPKYTLDVSGSIKTTNIIINSVKSSPLLATDWYGKIYGLNPGSLGLSFSLSTVNKADTNTYPIGAHKFCFLTHIWIRGARDFQGGAMADVYPSNINNTGMQNRYLRIQDSTFGYVGDRGDIACHVTCIDG